MSRRAECCRLLNQASRWSFHIDSVDYKGDKDYYRFPWLPFKEESLQYQRFLVTFFFFFMLCLQVLATGSILNGNSKPLEVKLRLNI